MINKEEKKVSKVFISYSHDSADHKQWVGELASRLRENGIDVILDQWDSGPGNDIPKFMENGVSEADRLLMICTEPYVRKADERKGATGYEAMIVAGELERNLGTSKFIPIIRQEAGSCLLPKSVSTRFYVNLSDDQNFEDQFELLLRELHQEPAVVKPPLGNNPFAKQPSSIETTAQIIKAIPQTSLPTKTRKRPITYSLRPSVKHFVNREKMRERLKADLRDKQKVIIVVDGLPGIGKTSLAAKVAEEVEDEFAGIYYTKCSQNTDLDQLLAELAYFLGEHGDNSFENVFEYNIPQENKINFLLSSLSQRRYLLVFDNLHELLDKQCCLKDRDLQLLFNELLAQAHHSKILLVSRIRPIFYRYQVSQAKNTLEELDAQGGIELLQILGVAENGQLLQQAYQLTTGHPLAMELLASLVEVMPLEAILANKNLFYKDASVAEYLLQELYNTLNLEEQTLLLKIAILPHPAPKEVICYLGENENIFQILKSLVRKALVTYDNKSKVYRQHDLIRDFDSSKMTDQEKEAYHLKAAMYYESLEYNKEKPTFDQVEQRLEGRYHYFQAGHYEKAASILIEASVYLRKWGYLERCRRLLEEALSVIKCHSSTDERKSLTVNLLVELSWIERFSKGLDKAIDCCKKAAKILKTIEDKKGAGNLYHTIGRYFYEKASWKEADIYLNHSFKIKTREGDTKGLVKLLNELRDLYWSLGKLEKIEEKCREGVKVCEQYEDVESKLEILVNVFGKTLEDQRKFDKALLVYEESLLSRKKDDFAGKAISLRRIGRVLRKQKKFENALKKYEDSLSLAEESGDVILQGYALEGMGNIYVAEGKIDEAVKKYEEAVKLSSQSKDLYRKASVLLGIAQAYGRAGKFKKALKEFEKRLQLKRKANDLIGVTVTLNNIGFLYSTKYSDCDNGLKYYKESLGIKKKLGQTIAVDLEKNNIASIYKKQGKLDEALKILEEILGIEEDRQISSRLITLGRRIYTLNNMADIYRIKGEFQKALEFLKESMQLCKKGGRIGSKSFTLDRLGKVHMDLDDYTRALTALRESLQLRTSHHGKVTPLTNIAEVYYLQGKLAEAMTKCEESLVLSRQYGSKIQAGVTLHLMAKIRFQEKQYEEALNYSQEAVDIFKTTGSRHLPEAEETLRQIQAKKE